MRRPRLHKSSIIVGLVVSLILSLMIIPGRSASRGGAFPGTGYAESFEHGWPRVYFERTVYTSWPPGRPYEYLPNQGIPWLGASNWRLWEAMQLDGVSTRTFSAGMLALDLAAGVIIIGIAVAAWEFRRRRRAGPFSFRLADLLAVLTVASLLFAWLAYNQREYERERQITKEQYDGWSFWHVSDTRCIAPLWVQALLGKTILPKYSWRASTVAIDAMHQSDMPQTGRPISDLDKLAYLRSVNVNSDDLHLFDYSQLRDIQQMETLYADCGLTATDVDGISQLVQLRKLRVCDLRDVDPELIARLAAALPGCSISD